LQQQESRKQKAEAETETGKQIKEEHNKHSVVGGIPVNDIRVTHVNDENV
jgi:hypothetical protein